MIPIMKTGATVLIMLLILFNACSPKSYSETSIGKEVEILQQDTIRLAAQEGAKILGRFFLTNFYQHTIGCVGM